jgi:SAM-dependent methyltransferase
MEFSERKRLVWYSILLLLVIGGMVYLNEERRKVRGDEAATQASNANGNQNSAENNKTAVDKPFTPKPYPYEQKQASRDGTGKIYMGREISKVMGHAAINWLERPERDAEEATSQVIQGLERELSKDAVVVDVGSGSGYYSFRLAKLVPQGKVIGVDVQPEMVTYLAKKAQQIGVSNVESRLGRVDSVQLPPEYVDAVIMVDAYHEFSHPNEMMQSIICGLKSKGRIYLLEYRAEDPEVPIKPLHKMSEAQVIKEMQAVGLRHVKTEGFLPWQHFMVFEKY